MILFFTGTGNSEYAARRIGRITGETPVSLVNRIRSGDTSPLESETPWVICAPIYAWQMPRIVRDHIAATELRGSRDVYFVLTCGGDTGNADKYARRLCESKGLNFRGLARVVMPENYIAMFSAPDEEEARRIIEKAVPGIDAAAELIREGRDLPPVKKGVMAGFLSAAVNRGFYASAIKDRDFFATDACISCGLCAEVCPLGNIELRDGRPVWKGTCTQCMSCICRCPVQAIEYGKKSAGKPRYICPDI
ncbi:MAG: EFR1 family ferrodoxin [Oscillospiraceae bacterium]|nr:EFR1 family ferrodoxin [Oscillospiraceae bacterium]